MVAEVQSLHLACLLVFDGLSRVMLGELLLGIVAGDVVVGSG